MDANGLTPIQGLLLIMLDPKKGKSMNHLSSLMVCDASNITGLVDRLEGRGLIERHTDPQDRRVKVINLSPAGTAMRDKLLDELQEAETVDMQKLTDDEACAFYGALNKLTDGLTK